MRAAVLLVLLGGCVSAGAPLAIAAAVGSSAVSRATGGCLAQCIAGTECDHQSGLCVPRRAPGDTPSSVPAAPQASAAPLPEGHTYDEPRGGFDCRTESGWGDQVMADSPANAATVCQELSGEPCTCVSTGE